MTMRYCTLDDIKLAIPGNTLIALSNDDPRATGIDQAVIERAVKASEEMIDANLRGRYLLPLQTVPTVINEAAVTLVRHWLYCRRPEGPELPKAVISTFASAMNTLAAIRDGKLTIGLPTGEAAPEPGKYKVRAAKSRFDQIKNGCDV
jgi:phage gp36-like protein